MNSMFRGKPLIVSKVCSAGNIKNGSVTYLQRHKRVTSGWF